MGAKIGNQNALGNEGGRPTLYKEEYAELAYNYTLLGATDAILAKFFNVSEQTINNWKNEHIEFFEALKKGKEYADMNIAGRLFERAKGVVIKTQQAFKFKTTEYNEQGKKVRDYEDVQIVDLEQEQPPDTTAIIFWLKNRNPEYWRDKVENKVTLSGGITPIIEFGEDETS